MPRKIKSIRIGSFELGATEMPVLIAGPCVIESRDHVLKMGEKILQIASRYGYHYLFKTSYDKANRSSIHSYRGPGLDTGLEILCDVKKQLGVPVLTDIHAVDQIKPVAEVADMIQIPAFLCRQTDLYIEAGTVSIPVNVKKGQFLAPEDMANVIQKAVASGVNEISLTERGTSFGYHRLVVDFAGLAVMKHFNVPIIFDGTHSLQLPGSGGTFTGGIRELVPDLCRAAVAVGCEGLFLEVHDDPDHALCDGPNMITPQTLESILIQVRAICEALRE